MSYVLLAIVIAGFLYMSLISIQLSRVNRLFNRMQVFTQVPESIDEQLDRNRWVSEMFKCHEGEWLDTWNRMVYSAPLNPRRHLPSLFKDEFLAWELENYK